jgi:hypothetical protein
MASSESKQITKTTLLRGHRRNIIFACRKRAAQKYAESIVQGVESGALLVPRKTRVLSEVRVGCFEMT